MDQGYRGPFLAWVKQVTRITLQVVVRHDGGMRSTWAPVWVPPRIVPRFAVVPRRRVVERTFAWPGRYRRLAEDYEYLPATSENTVYLAMAFTLLHRLARAAIRRFSTPFNCVFEKIVCARRDGVLVPSGCPMPPCCYPWIWLTHSGG